MAGAPKLTVHDGETPTAQLIKQAVQETVIADSQGRNITLKKPAVLAQFRLVKILGEDAENRVYMSMVAPLIFVTAIDGEPVAFPQSQRELEALIQRLDEHGLEAVMKGVGETWGQLDPEAAKDEIKK